MENTANSQVASKRDMMSKRIREKYPDRQYEDDEALFGQIYDDYDDYDKRISGYQEREGKLSEMFGSDPKSAAFFMKWKNGGDPAVELVRMFGSDIADAQNDPERMDAIAEANKEFVAAVAKEKELTDEYKSNLAATIKSIEDYQQSNGVSDEQMDAAMALLAGIVKDGILGKFTPENIDMAMKAINHDEDVANAGDEGEIRGKNARIEERLRKQQAGDGIPVLGGNSGTQKPKRNAGIFDLAAEAR